MGIRDGSRLGFWRHVLGQGEKWQLVKGSPTSGTEEPHTRGTYVRSSDHVMLKSPHTDMLVGVSEGSSDGRGVRLVHRERAFGGAEVWQLHWASAVPLPSWMATRPYLKYCMLLLLLLLTSCFSNLLLLLLLLTSLLL